jgi:hypothetical protein
VKDSQVRASGDIALENGLIVKDLMRAAVGPNSSDEALIERARSRDAVPTKH